MNLEFKGNIYQDAQGLCCFVQTPKVGTKDSSTAPPVSTLPAGAERVATYHTHAAFDRNYDNEHFSPQDRKAARTLGVPDFVGTPAGVIREYNPHASIFHRTITFKERTE